MNIFVLNHNSWQGIVQFSSLSLLPTWNKEILLQKCNGIVASTSSRKLTSSNTSSRYKKRSNPSVKSACAPSPAWRFTTRIKTVTVEPFHVIILVVKSKQVLWNSSTRTLMCITFVNSHAKFAKRLSGAILVLHMDLAHADHSYSCPIEGCDAKFLHLWSMRAHSVRVHEIKSHPKAVCKLCGHDFKGLAQNLRNHMKPAHWLDSFKKKFGKLRKEGENEDVPEGHFAPRKLSIRNDA